MTVVNKPLADSLRAVSQRNDHRRRSEYIRLLEQLEFCVRNKVDPAKVLIDLDAHRRGVR